jgi:hypothetical protein
MRTSTIQPAEKQWKWPLNFPQFHNRDSESINHGKSACEKKLAFKPKVATCRDDWRERIFDSSQSHSF